MPDGYTSRTLREIVRVVARRFVGVVLIIAMFIGGAWLLTYLTPREYRSEVQLLAEASQPIEPLAPQAATSLRESISLFVQTQREIILSDHVIASALVQLEGEALPEPYSDEGLDSEQQKIRLNRWEDEVAAWDRTVQEYIRENARYLHKAKRRVSVLTPGGPEAAFTKVFRIRVDWPTEPEIAGDRDPGVVAAERAYEMTRHLTAAYHQRYTQLELIKARQEARVFEQDVLAAARTDLEDATKELRAFVDRPEVKANLLHVINTVAPGGAGLETGLAANVRAFAHEIDGLKAEESQLAYYRDSVIGPQVRKAEALDGMKKEFDRVEARIAGIQDARVEATSQLSPAAAEARRRETERHLNELDERLGALIQKMRQFSLVVPDDATAANVALRNIQARAVVLRLKLDELTTNYQYLHESVRKAARELLSVWQTLAMELGDQEQKVADKLASLGVRRDALAKILSGDGGEEGIRQRLEKLGPLAVQYDRLYSRVTAAQETYNRALDKSVEARNRRRQAPKPILATVMDEPNRPDPDRWRWPILWLNLLIGGVAGVILSMVYAFMADHFDHTNKGIADAERYLGTPVLASVSRLGHGIVRVKRGE